MLLARTYIRRETTSLILLDVDGRGVSMPLQHALALLDWLQAHKREIEEELHFQDKIGGLDYEEDIHIPKL